jgi:phosphate/sulfate permease
VIVRNFINITKIIQKVTPKKVQKFMSSRFEQVQGSSKEKTSFDFIRASVILICSSILISIATAYKLPLSTTYVTFMVAMGAAFADKSWGRESAVYRVNGVLTVIV